jgi:hypothetical protein
MRPWIADWGGTKEVPPFLPSSQVIRSLQAIRERGRALVPTFEAGNSPFGDCPAKFDFCRYLGFSEGEPPW